MKRFLNIALTVGLLAFITGCATVNKGLDNTADATRDASQTVGKVMNVPTAVAEGAAEGMIQRQDEENPYNR